jgi:hypothetical protein
VELKKGVADRLWEDVVLAIVVINSMVLLRRLQFQTPTVMILLTMVSRVMKGMNGRGSVDAR